MLDPLTHFLGVRGAGKPCSAQLGRRWRSRVLRNLQSVRRVSHHFSLLLVCGSVALLDALMQAAIDSPAPADVPAALPQNAAAPTNAAASQPPESTSMLESPPDNAQQVPGGVEETLGSIGEPDNTQQHSEQAGLSSAPGPSTPPQPSALDPAAPQGLGTSLGSKKLRKHGAGKAKSKAAPADSSTSTGLPGPSVPSSEPAADELAAVSAPDPISESGVEEVGVERIPAPSARGVVGGNPLADIMAQIMRPGADGGAGGLGGMMSRLASNPMVGLLTPWILLNHNQPLLVLAFMPPI